MLDGYELTMEPVGDVNHHPEMFELRVSHLGNEDPSFALIVCLEPLEGVIPELEDFGVITLIFTELLAFV